MAIHLEGKPARGRTLGRMGQIANILFRQGFEVFVDKTPLSSLVTPDCRADTAAACRCEEERGACHCGHALPLPERFKNSVIELGPTFIKLGQIASTRPDLVPQEYSDPLRELQEHVPPFVFKEVRRIIEEELGQPPEQAFRSLEERPIASASLSQVHFAELKDGTPVAVKVQRPNLQAIIEQDLTIMRWIARQVARFNPGMRYLQPEAIVDEFGRWTLRELDFQLEGRTYDEFRQNFAGQDDVVFPKVYWDYTNRRLLTMERVDGMRIHEVTPKLHAQERHRLARRLAEIELQMLITDAFFHADLHPGNIFFKPDGRIVILDVGMVGRMNPEMQDRFLCYWIAITRNQRERALHHLLKMARSTAKADLGKFRQRYNAILDQFYGASLSERSMARTYLDILLAAAECKVVMPSDMMLQAKAVVTAEALDLVLYPKFEFTEEARPIVAREIAKRASPRHLMDRIWSGLAEFILLGESPPAGPLATTEKLDERRFRREVIKSLAYVWAEDIDEKLRDKQMDIARYTSADYWAGHPEIHAVLQTGLGILRLFSMLMDRALWASEPETEAASQPATAVGTSAEQKGKDGPQMSADDGKERYNLFLKETFERHGKGRSWTEDVCQTAAYWEDQARSFCFADFWEEKQILRSELKSGLTILRLSIDQLAQAIESKQRENEDNDAEVTGNASSRLDKPTPEP